MFLFEMKTNQTKIKPNSQTVNRGQLTVNYYKTQNFLDRNDRWKEKKISVLL